MSVDTILGIVGLVIGIIGLILAFLFYRWGLKKKEPCWSIQNENLIRDFSSRLEKLEIKYARKRIENLTVSKIVFWNQGRETIDADDIRTASPLMILANGDHTEILDVKVIQNNSLSSRFSVQLLEDKKAALMFFDYLDHNQGAMLQVVHTGIDMDSIIVVGDIKGADGPKQKLLQSKRSARAFWIDTIVNAFLIAIVTTTIAPLLTSFPPWLIILLILGLLVVVSSWLWRLANQFRDYPRIPKALNPF